MNILDENIAESQRRLPMSRRIRVKQIGQDIADKGIKDWEQIIPLLHSLPRPVLFTNDMAFYTRRLVHKRYCLVALNVHALETAKFIRRFLGHSAFTRRPRGWGKWSLSAVRACEFGVTIKKLN